MITESSPSPSGLTRRSFMKTSVVAAIAAANLTIMSGLVDAANAPYVDDQGNCIIEVAMEHGGVCAYTEQETYCYPCSIRHLCCYLIVICNGQEMMGMAWQCPEKDGEDLDQCYAFESKKPPLLKRCDPLA